MSRFGVYRCRRSTCPSNEVVARASRDPDHRASCAARQAARPGAHRDRPGHARGHAAADGDGRRVGRQRRRDPPADVVDRIEGADGSTSVVREAEGIGRAMTPQTRPSMTQMMIQVVEEGTGTAGADPGRPGRGQDRHRRDRAGEPNDAWFIAFAPADDPKVAIAVLVEHTAGRATAGRSPRRSRRPVIAGGAPRRRSCSGRDPELDDRGWRC